LEKVKFVDSDPILNHWLAQLDIGEIEAICDTLDCQPGDILEYKKG